MKSKKKEVITDDMVGAADPVCICSANVGEIIIKKNEKTTKRTSLKKIQEKVRGKRA